MMGMNLAFNQLLAKGYKSPPQKVRVMTEGWVDREAYCPACGDDIEQFPNNNPAGDFYCLKCGDTFELKSKKDKFGSKVVDGEFRTMTKAIGTGENPNFFLLTYQKTDWKAKDFFVVPGHYFNLELIEARRPLSNDAKRHGWKGCNILLNRIPDSGRIFILKECVEVPKKDVLNNWRNTSFLGEIKGREKGWTVDVMRVIELLKVKEFKLADIYMFECHFKQLHPDNQHIKDKIRQQLQVLRDVSYIKFLGSGSYRLLL